MRLAAKVLTEISKLLICTAGLALGQGVFEASPHPSVTLLSVALIGIAAVSGLIVLASWVVAIASAQFGASSERDMQALDLAVEERATTLVDDHAEKIARLELDIERAQKEAEEAEELALELMNALERAVNAWEPTEPSEAHEAWSAAKAALDKAVGGRNE